MKNENALTAQIIIKPDILFDDNYILNDRDFENKQNRLIIQTVKDCLQENLEPNILMLRKKNNSLDPAVLAKYSDFPTSANWNYYHDLVVEESRKRKLSYLSKLIQDDLKANKKSDNILKNIDEVLGEFGNYSKKNKIYEIKELCLEYTEMAETNYHKAQKGEDCLPGIRTGLNQLDDLTLGFQKDHFILIGARPSEGKTALLINIACNCSFDADKKVGFISTESSRQQLTGRIFASEASISTKNVQTGFINSVNMHDMINLGSRIHEKYFYLYDSPNAKLGEVKTIAKRMKDIYDIDILFIDYLQNIQNENRKIPKHEQVEEISRELKQLNRRLEIPVVCSAQLTRDSQNREPELNDFRYSGQIEQDADDVIFIYHYKDKNSEKEHTRLLVKKGRDTGTGTINMRFEKKYVRFKEVVYEGD